MHHRKMYMYINFQQNRVSRSVKTVHTNLFTNICKLHKFATCSAARRIVVDTIVHLTLLSVLLYF